MAVVFVKVFYTPPEGVEREITDSVLINDARGLELNSARTTLNVHMSEKFVTDESIFQEDGTFEIYCDYAPITRTTEQLLLSGNLREIGYEYRNNSRIAKLEAADRSVLMLNVIWSQTLQSEEGDEGDGAKKVRSFDVIREVVPRASEEIDLVTHVQTTKSDGSPLDPIDQLSLTGKSIFEWVTEVSQTARTGDVKTFQFFVDKENKLHWYFPSTTSDGTIVEGIDDIISIDLNRNADDILNYIIFNAGADLKGNGKNGYFFDTQQRSSEIKGRYFPLLQVSRELFDREIKAGNLIQDSEDGFVFHQGQFYSPAEFPFITTWLEEVTDFENYNEAFRNRLDLRGKQEANKITNQFSKLRWKGNIDLIGTHDWTAGDLVELTVGSLGIIKELVRVQDVQHTINNQGWVTKLQVEQDEEAISETIE